MAYHSHPLERIASQAESEHTIFSSQLLDDTDSKSPLHDTGLRSPTNTDRKDSFAASSISVLSPQSTASNWDDYPVPPGSLFLTERQLYTASPFSESALPIIN